MSEISVWSWAKETIREYWRSILTIFVVTAILAVGSAVFPLIWQRLIDKADDGFVDYRMAILFTFLFVLEVTPVVFLLRARFTNRYKLTTRYRMFKHMLHLSVPFYRSRNTSKLLAEANRGVSAGADLLKLLMDGGFLTNIPVAIFAFGYVTSHNYLAGGILVVFMTLFALLSSRLGKKVSDLSSKLEERANALNARAREVLQHIEVVKLHLAEKQEDQWYLESSQDVLKLRDQLMDQIALFNTMSSLSSVLPFAVSAFVFLPSVAEGTITIGGLLALQMYSAKAVGPIGDLGDMYQDLKTNVAILKPALRILQQKPTVVESRNPVQMQPLRDEMCIKRISFGYEEGEMILRNISCTIRAGEIVAIVGPSGSGKTTFLRLLARFYDPNSGIITVDGTDLRQLSFDSLYAQVSYLTQDVPIFSGTIAENIQYGLSDSDDEALERACRSASAEFVFQKKHGLKTHAGELGSQLSGGEQKRIALARLFLRQPSILLLDEATDGLDPTTRKEVQDAFDQLLATNSGMTMVVIAHRMRTIETADRILVIEGGQIADQGSHQELLKRCGLYRQLCDDEMKA